MYKFGVCKRGHDLTVPGARHRGNGYCKECQKSYRRELRWRLAGILNSDGQFFKIADYDRLFDRQFGRCEICQAEPTAKRRLDVDHDHKSGQARTLLCARCNFEVVGAVEKYGALIPAAQNYLGHTNALIRSIGDQNG